MKTLKDYISDSETWAAGPAQGDDFAINIREECLVESYVVDTVEDGVVIAADERMIGILESYGLLESMDPSAVAEGTADNGQVPLAIKQLFDAHGDEFKQYMSTGKIGSRSVAARLSIPYSMLLPN